jgi:hypothetical protein
MRGAVGVAGVLTRGTSLVFSSSRSGLEGATITGAAGLARGVLIVGVGVGRAGAAVIRFAVGFGAARA